MEIRGSGGGGMFIPISELYKRSTLALSRCRIFAIRRDAAGRVPRVWRCGGWRPEPGRDGAGALWRDGWAGRGMWIGLCG